MRYAFVGLCLVVMLSGGCTLLDSFFGVRPDGTRDPSGGAATAVGGILNTIIPGASAIVAGAGGLWAAFRGKKWKDAAISTIDVIEAGAKAGKSVRDLKGELKVAHDAKGVGGLVKAVVDRYGHSKAVAPPTG